VTSHPHRELPVLIVGAGPAGLTTAVALARHGVHCLLVERRTDLSSLPRATAISTRSMEILRSWGLEDDIRAGEVEEVEWLQWYCRTLADAAAGHGTPTGLPSRGQSALVSPTAPTCVPQDHLEPVLLDHLRSLPAGRAELGTEVIAVDHRPDGVRVSLRDVRGGATRTVDARYVVAADGAHSSVRRRLGIPMRGPDRLNTAVSALFRAPLWERAGEARYGLYAITHPEAEGVLLPAGRGDRWIFGALSDPGRPSPELSEEILRRRIVLAAGAPRVEPRIERVGRFSFSAQLAERFRVGRAFLVGDAAHRATPRGGTGMNTAIHDGYDLGWKLAWVLRGWAGTELLDSYEAERRPVAEHNVTRSADPTGSHRGPDQETRVDLGGRVAHAWVPGAGDRVSTLDLLGAGLTLFSSENGARWKRAAATVPSRAPLTVHALDAITARALGVPSGGALLVRPDGAPASWLAGGSDAPSALRAAIALYTVGRSGSRLRRTARFNR
jgi:putative polyketide hydroxylase